MARCRREFERLVERVLQRIPPRFREAMANLAIVIDDWPDPELMTELYGDPEEVLYGLFEGTPLPERGVDDSGDLPAVIHLYRGPLEQDYSERGELEHEVEVTLVHEIAHFMGLDENAIREYGYE